MPAIAPWKSSTIMSPTGLTTSAAVGVDKTFSPEGFIAPGVARWVDRSLLYAVLYPSKTLSVRRPKNGGKNFKVLMKIDLPTADITAPTTVTGIQPAPSKAYSNGVSVEFTLPERGTAAERLVLLNLLKSALETTITASDGAPSDATASPLVLAVTDFEAPYGQ